MIELTFFELQFFFLQLVTKISENIQRPAFRGHHEFIFKFLK